MAVDSEPPQQHVLSTATGTAHINTLPAPIISSEGLEISAHSVKVHWSKHIGSVNQLSQIHLPWQ